MADQDFPLIVYKYRNWTDPYHQAMLRDNELFLSSPADFNDPFDCRIPVNYLLLNTEEKILDYVNGFVARETEDMLQRGIDPGRMSRIMVEELTTQREETQARSETMEFKRMDEHYGVLSLSARWDSILMWSHYADKHRGFCLGFHEKS